MNDNKLKHRQKRDAAIAKMAELNDLEAERDLTEDEVAAFEAAEKDVEAADAAIARIDSRLSFSVQTSKSATKLNDNPDIAKDEVFGKAIFARLCQKANKDGSKWELSQEDRARYHNTISESGGTQTLTVPAETAAIIEEARDWPLLGRVTMEPTTSLALNVPVIDFGGHSSEGKAIGTSATKADPATARTLILRDRVSSKVAQVGIDMIENAPGEIGRTMRTGLTNSLNRLMNGRIVDGVAATSGDVNQIIGVESAPAARTQNVVVGTADAVGEADVRAMRRAIPDEYLDSNRVNWLFNPETFDDILQLRISAGATAPRAFPTDLSQNPQESLLGQRVVRSNTVPAATGAGNTDILGYLLDFTGYRLVIGQVKFSEYRDSAYDDSYTVGFHAQALVGGAWCGPQLSFVKLTNKA